MIIQKGMAGLVAVVFVGGCASVPREAGFGRVQGVIAERTGHLVQWRGRTAAAADADADADAEVDTAVRSLLQHGLSVEEAVQVALLNNLNLQATYQELGVSQADLVQAGLLKNPVFSGEIRFPADPRPPIELDVFANFVDVFLLPLRKRFAAAEFEASRLRVTQAALDLVAETRVAFYTAQAAEQILEMRRAVVAATRASAEAAARLRAAGNITALEVRNEQGLAARARLELAAAEAEAVRDRARLNVLMGLWGENTTWRIGTRLPDPPAGDVDPTGLESAAVTQRLDLAAARQQVEAAGQSLGLSRTTRFLPELVIGGHFEREPEGKKTFGPSLEVPIPLFDQGQAAIARGGAMLAQARLRYAALAVEIRSEIRAAHQAMTAARSRAEYYRREVLPLQHQIVQDTQLQYNATQVGVFQLLQAKQAEIDAGREYIESLRNSWTARAQLEKALGGKLPSESPGLSSASQPAVPEVPAAEQPPEHHHED